MIAPNWEQPKCPFSGEWIKQPWYIQILEYYSEWNNREKITGSCNNMDECQMPLAKWKKPESKDYILCGSNYMTCLENAKITGTDQWLLGVEWAGWGPQLGVEGAVWGVLWGRWEPLCILIKGSAWLHAFVSFITVYTQNSESPHIKKVSKKLMCF